MGGSGYTGNNLPTSTVSYSGLQVQTTSSCLPIPIAYGQSMFAPNCIWYNNFQRHAQGPKGGAKGGMTSGKTQQTYIYSAAVILALCEGPISNIGMILNGSPPSITLAEINTGLVDGNSPQSVWSYLTASYPSQALAYNGVAYLCSPTFDLGSSASIGSYTFEVMAAFAGTGFNGVDADPAQVIYDFLTNAQYGVGFPAASIDTSSLYANSGDSSYQTYCRATGIAISPVLNNTEQAMSILTRWLQITNSTAVWSGGLLKIIPYGDDATTGNGATWTPNVTPLYALTDDDFINADGEDPIKITRSDPYSLSNWQSVEIMCRNDYYNTGPVSAWDQSAIDRFGLRLGSTVTAHEICDTGIAQTVAQLILQRGLYIRNTYQFKLSWEFCLLDPMDLVTLTDVNLGLSGTVVRITTIEEDSDGMLAVTAEEFPQGIATAVAYPVQAKSNGYPDPTVAAPAVNTPVIFEPPAALTNNTSQIWAAVSGPNANWGGCVVWASIDGVTYGQVASLTGASSMGVTTSSVTAFSGSNPDTADTLGVSLAESFGTLTSTTGPNAAAGVTACYIGGEYVAFTTATLTGSSTYNLTGLYRGMFGVASQAIASGASFAALSGNLVKYTIPAADIGDTIYLKFQSFNIYGGGLEDLSTCTAYSYGVSGFGVIGPVAATLAAGTAMDFGLVSAAVTETDDFGFASGSVSSSADLGNVTS